MSSVLSAKKKTGRPRVDSEAVNVRFERTWLDSLDAWIARLPDPRPSRPEAIRQLVEKALGTADAGSIAAEDLNASNDE